MMFREESLSEPLAIHSRTGPNGLWTEGGPKVRLLSELICAFAQSAFYVGILELVCANSALKCWTDDA